MTKRGKIIAGIALVLVLGSATVISIVQGGNGRGIEVRMEEVQTRDLVATVTVSGNIRARRAVDISADVMGRIIELNVEEGDDVTEGTILLRIDPSQLEATVARAQATLSQARAQAAQQRANLLRSDRDNNRMAALWARDSTLVSRQQVEDAATTLEVAQALYEAAEFGVSQAGAALEEAQDQLGKTIITAPMSGKVTRLNVEVGETVVLGTMNNPGSLILTISDLSVVEAVMEVDETDVPEITLGDSAILELDAFPGRAFGGRVTEIGNSAIRPPSQTAGTGQTAAIDFEVVITLDDPGIQLRPDLSATADIVTATRTGVPSIPIISLTVREPEGDSVSRGARTDEESSNVQEERRPEGPVARSQQDPDIEGVFVVREGLAYFTPVEVGITGQEYFEVISGVQVGDTVVAGPYQRIRELNNEDPVRLLEEEAGNGGPSGRGAR
ncbi:MAG: efflux RND transporter periplasmic adaptor subunit [Gemmatimonadetes bacterium]|nr:efflux RND transporter periplasmic adaptor subunit [Gemmatimonadota bacterium]NNM07000.1 efflux RND transporter periplasmic adaptor subunit [Gemmatimonadota bacterium]